MNSFLVNASSYIVSTVFGLYIIVVLLRFILQLIRADFYNPLSQFIVKATTPALKPFRKVIPGLFGMDMASLTLAYLLQCLETTILWAIQGIPFNFVFLLWHSIGYLLVIALYIYFFAILVQVIISWVSPGNYNPATALIHQITEPVMRPARRVIPPISGFDLSPILVFMVINILIMFINAVFGIA